jgi:hypothetical protein
MPKFRAFYLLRPIHSLLDNQLPVSVLELEQQLVPEKDLAMEMASESESGLELA